MYARLGRRERAVVASGGRGRAQGVAVAGHPEWARDALGWPDRDTEHPGWLGTSGGWPPVLGEELRSWLRDCGVVVFCRLVVISAAAELDASDDGVLGVAGAVVGFPLAVDQPAGDRDHPAFGEVLV